MTVAATMALVPLSAAALAFIDVTVTDPAGRRRLIGVLLDAFLPGLGRAVLASSPLPLGATRVAMLALAGALLAGLGWVRTVRRACRAMCELDPGPMNVLLEKRADLATFGWVCLTGVAAGAAAVGGRVLIHLTVDWAGPAAVGTAMMLATWLLGAGATAAASVVLLCRVTPRTALSFRRCLAGGMFAAAASMVLKLGYGLWVAHSHNQGALYGAFAAVAGLIAWVSLMSRVTVLSATWASMPAAVPDGAKSLPDGRVGPAMTAHRSSRRNRHR